jgi:signal transduction histidine kinase
MVEDVTERRRHEQERDFLAQASEVLASSLDYEATLGSVTRLAVQELADWCAVDEGAPGGGIHRIAVAHPDPAMVEFAARMYEKYPMDPDAPSGIAWVLRTGEPELVPFVPDEVLVESAVDAEHLRMIRELDVGSYICVPLIARDRILGALTLVSGRAGRRFGEHDLWLAEELARRAALAIDNARLYSESEHARLRLEEQATELEAQAEELQVQALQLEEAQLELEMSNDELRRAHDETAERAAEAERARAAAEEANLAKSQFLATMSHELRTPLNAIGGYVELMDMEIHGPVTDAQRDSLGRIRRGQQRLLGLINDVLNFARIEAGQVQYRFENVVLDETLQGMRALVEPLITGKDLHYEYLPGRPVLVRADRERLEQIVLNLLSNAVKFTSPGGGIEVGWNVTGAYADVWVRDTGRGIPAKDLEAIFEPFVQVDPSLTRESQGTGLGLAISRDLARAMGGEITARSTPGEGSTFQLRLPLADDSPASG